MYVGYIFSSIKGWDPTNTWCTPLLVVCMPTRSSQLANYRQPLGLGLALQITYLRQFMYYFFIVHTSLFNHNRLVLPLQGHRWFIKPSLVRLEVENSWFFFVCLVVVLVVRNSTWVVWLQWIVNHNYCKLHCNKHQHVTVIRLEICIWHVSILHVPSSNLLV